MMCTSTWRDEFMKNTQNKHKQKTANERMNLIIKDHGI